MTTPFGLPALGTPFHAATGPQVRTTWWYAWDKFVMPDVYTNMPRELHAIRQAAALIDMSPLPKMEIAGPDAHHLVNRLMTRDMAGLRVEHAMYSPWCNDSGLMVGDGLIFRLEETRFIVTGETSHAWFAAQSNGLDVALRNVSDAFGILALQGPRANEVLSAATGQDWSGLAFSSLRRTTIAGVEVFVARQGFTGERGFEVWVPAAGGATVWARLAEAGQPFGAVPAGEYAVDVARIEAGLILVSADYTGAGPDPRTARVDVTQDLHITPFEAGLGRLVDLGHDFVGREALARLADTQRDRRHLVGLRHDAAAILAAAAQNSPLGSALNRVFWGSMRVLQGETPVGRACSLAFSPTLRAAISFAFLPAALTAPGTTVDVEILDDTLAIIGILPAQVVPLPFIDLRRSTPR